MCLIICGINVHPEYELVLVANRDEFHNRGALEAHFWEKPQIVAGKDLLSGGTWIAVDKYQRLAAVTNFRDPMIVKEDAPSRGELPVRFLEKDVTALDFLDFLSKKDTVYNGFNLILKDRSGVFHYSNVSRQITPLTDGIYGLSNAFLDTKWPKVVRGKEKLKEALERGQTGDRALADLLYDKTLANEADLPSTGIPPELEKNLSAMFIKIPEYGTRCTTVVKIKKNGSISFAETVYNSEGERTGENNFLVGAQ